METKEGAATLNIKALEPIGDSDEVDAAKIPTKTLSSLRYKIYKKTFPKGKVNIDLNYPDGPNMKRETNFIIFYRSNAAAKPGPSCGGE